MCSPMPAAHPTANLGAMTVREVYEGASTMSLTRLAELLEAGAAEVT